MTDKKFSILLKEKRDALRLSQEKMAGKMGMKLRMYQIYERGDFDDTHSVRRDKYLHKLSQLGTDEEKEPTTQGNIIYVPLYAYGGFLGGYRNIVFIDQLDHFRLPGVTGEHYAFEIGGYSMMKPGHELSATPGDVAISRLEEDFKHMLKGKGYILQTIDGLVYKLFEKISSEKAYFNSLNGEFESISMPLKEIKRVYFVDFILKKTH